MASHLEIGTGPLTARIDWTNDAMVQKTLLQFWDQRVGVNLPEGEPQPSNQEKLEQVLGELVEHVVGEIRGKEGQERLDAAKEAIRQEVVDEYDFRKGA